MKSLLNWYRRFIVPQTLLFNRKGSTEDREVFASSLRTTQRSLRLNRLLDKVLNAQVSGTTKKVVVISQ